MSVRAWITRDPIDPAAVLARVGAAADGATVLFLGTVRDHNDGRAVTGVCYRAYEEMAVKALAGIAREAAGRLGTDRIAMVHRVGNLEIGEVSVAIAASSPHRAESFDVVRYVLEQIKQRVPVWKRERYAEGDSRWLDGAVPGARGSGE